MTDSLGERFAKAGQAAQQQTEAEQLKALGLPPNVSIENATEAMQLKPEDPNAIGPWVQYNGVATVRFMNEEAWKDCGVQSTSYHEWNYLNKKRLPMSIFTDDELQYLLRRDGRFSLVEE